MTKSILIAGCAGAVLTLAACNYNKNYNNEAANYGEANYSENAAGYGNATEYNATNETYGNETANMPGNVANNSANTVTNNGY
jgi:hypothetical protein